MKGRKLWQSGFIFVIAILLLQITACNNKSLIPGQAGNIRYAGVRSSAYGIVPFPDPESWKYAMDTMAGFFKEAQPIAIWLVGEVDISTGAAGLEFPSPGGSYAHIAFADLDRHEGYLNYFDANGIKVFLQVEPGLADIKTLIDLVLNRYGRHSCVAGFGIDVEWYGNFTIGHPGTPVTDTEAAVWEREVKSYNPAYRLLMKHYDTAYLCPKYRGELIFVDDTQAFPNINEFVTEMTSFAARFYPNPVFYQIGYESDESWWSRYDNPARALGERLAGQTRQECGIIWVDFTLRGLIHKF